MKKILLLTTLFICNYGFTHAQSDFGNALQFDGDNDYVNAGVRANLEMSDALTIEAWIYPKGEGSVDGGIIVNREGEYEIARRGGSIYVAIANTSPGWDWIYTGYFAPLNVWSHICFTYSASQQSFKFYANGEEVQSLFATGTIGDIGISQDLDEFWIGARQYDFGLPIKHQHFDGAIDEVRVWNKALTATEIKDWMRKSITSAHPEFVHLAGYWTFDEGKGITTADVSGHGNAGTLINSPKWITSTVPLNIKTFYADKDGDGFGDTGSAIESYSAPDGYITNNTDCDDNNASVHPNAIDLCNGVDDNCNGQIDEGITCYRDSDGDGFGNAANSLLVLDCNLPAGYVYDSTDCDDSKAAVNPLAGEITGDKIDNNCNGVQDENNALDFDGINDHVLIPNNNTLNITKVTIETWVKWSNSGTAINFICGKNYEQLEIHTGGGGGSNGLRFIPAANVFLDGPANILPSDVWTHVACVYDPSIALAKLYINGIEKPLTNHGGNPLTTPIGISSTAFNLGKRSDDTYFFQGELDEFRIWNRVLTQFEIQNNMKLNICGSTAGMVAYFPFNEGTADGSNSPIVIAHDVTSNNNNGTLSDFALTGTTSNWVAGGPGQSGFTKFYLDADGDGYGNSANSLLAVNCNLPNGYVYDSTDCNDANPNIHPGAKEIHGNNIDDNCNGIIDETSAVPTVSITKPSHDTIYIASARIKIHATASDADGTITKVEFYDGAILLHTEIVAPYDCIIDNAGVGHYTITAKAYDNDGNVTTSSAVNITVAPDIAPTVSMKTPRNHESFTAFANVILSADADDVDGRITKLEFYNGNTLIFTETAAPYERKWFHLKIGTYTITAKAYDNNGGVTTSAPVHFSVVPDIAPLVSITSPGNGANFTAPANIELSADASDLDGTVRTVDFYNGSTLLFTEKYLPYSKTWANVPQGNYTITAVATDNNGKTTTSAPVNIFVSAVPAPMAKSSKLNSSARPLSLHLNPNPVANTLNISVDGLQTNKQSTISILSVSGVVIKNIQTNSLNKITRLDVSSISAGVYYIKVINGDKILYKQFVKM